MTKVQSQDLQGGVASPGANKIYGTNGAGVMGFQDASSIITGGYDEEIIVDAGNLNLLGGITLAKFIGGVDVTRAGSDPRIGANLPALNDGSENFNQFLSFTDAEIIELEFDAGFASTANEGRRVGFVENDSSLYTKVSAARHVCVDHDADNAFVQLSTADGATQSAGSNVAMPGVYYKINRYKLVYAVGIDVKVYINGVLGDTKNTNIPLTSTGYITLGIGCTNGSATVLRLQNMVVRIKKN